MKKSKLTALFLFACITSFSFGQKVMSLEGDCSFLKGVKELNVMYDYADMGVGDYDDEADYVKKKVEEYNKKEAGRGDKWKESWTGSRKRVYQPKFEELFNKMLTGNGISIAEDRESAEYTLIVKTTFTEPGFKSPVMSKPAAVSFQYIFVKTGTDEVVAKFSQKMVPGAQAMGFDWDVSTRISESYAKGGKMLGAYIVKQLK